MNRKHHDSKLGLGWVVVLLGAWIFASFAFEFLRYGFAAYQQHMQYLEQTENLK